MVHCYACKASDLKSINSPLRLIRLLAIILAFTLSSCGFYPVYKERDREAMPEIQISHIDSVDGTLLYRRLSDLIGNIDDAKYLLQITLAYSSSPLAITKNSDVVQQSASQYVSYKLLYKDTNKVVISGSFGVSGSYNTTTTAYSAHTEEKQERMNLATKAADELEYRLIVHFSK
jgi:hypothetical protein